jgi:hypothetical protein
MSKSTTTHRAALKALASLLEVTAGLEYRLASLAECIDLDDVDVLIRDAGHAMARAESVLKATAEEAPTGDGEPAPVKGKSYRVKCVSDQTIDVVAESVEDAIHRAMCGEGNLVDTDTHDFVVTRQRKRA